MCQQPIRQQQARGEPGGQGLSRHLHVAGQSFVGNDHRMQKQERPDGAGGVCSHPVQVTVDGGPAVCCAGLSTSATVGSSWELSFKRNIGKSGACLVEGDQ